MKEAPFTNPTLPEVTLTTHCSISSHVTGRGSLKEVKSGSEYWMRVTV
jgi:hypothetical protein